MIKSGTRRKIKNLYLRTQMWGRNLAPSWGVKNWFKSVTAVCKGCIDFAVGKKWLRKCVLRGRETIFVNLDESPMAKQMKARRGYV